MQWLGATSAIDQGNGATLVSTVHGPSSWPFSEHNIELWTDDLLEDPPHHRWRALGVHDSRQCRQNSIEGKFLVSIDHGDPLFGHISNTISGTGFPTKNWV